MTVIAGRNIGIRNHGNGDKAFLIHCSLAHSGAWNGVMEQLGDILSMTALDLPGHGKTEFDNDQTVQSQSCETLIALLEEHGKPAHLIGHSFGATVALRTAIERPDLVKLLVLYEPVYFSLLPAKNPIAAEQEVIDSASFVTASERQDWSLAAQEFLKRWGDGEPFDQMPEQRKQYIQSLIPLVYSSTQEIISPKAGAKVLTGMTKVTHPTLVMEGEKTLGVIKRINDVIVDGLPNAERMEIAGAGHMGPVSRAPKFAELVRDFLLRNQS